MAEDERRTDSGIPVEPLYTAADLDGWDAATQLGEPGRPPYTRGIYPTMYRGRPWTIRLYSGWGTAEDTNERSIRLLAAKAGLDVASFETIVSPVNWTYSVRNTLEDLGAPAWLVNQFSLSTPVSLGVFTAFDAVNTAFGRGALLRVVLRRPY